VNEKYYLREKEAIAPRNNVSKFAKTYHSMQAPEFLTSNGLPIPFSDEYFKPMRVSHPNDQDLAVRYLEDGYIYLPSYIDREAALDIREQYLHVFNPIILVPGTTPRQGLFSGVFHFSPSSHGHPGHPASMFVQTELFDQFTNNKLLYLVAEQLLGCTVSLLPRRPLRHFYKGTNIASKAHADFTYLNMGTRNLLSVWVPLGDVALTGGSIVYLEKTHEADQEALRRALNTDATAVKDKRPLTADLKAIADLTGKKWLYTEFKAGDIVLHSPFIIHATLDCNTEAMRVSTDLRFAASEDKIDPRWKKSWRGDDGY
jgi:hypothetical protein